MTMEAEQQTRVEAQATLLGRWTYRSFMPDPDIEAEFGSLEFGRGELIIEYLCDGKFVGRLLFDPTYQFRLEGVATPGDPPTLKLRGIGDAEASRDQIYDYFGCVMPVWSFTTRQRLTIVGSVVRAVQHNGDAAPAGQAASFIAVKRDVPPRPAPDEGEGEDGAESEKPSEEGSGGGKRPRR